MNNLISGLISFMVNDLKETIGLEVYPDVSCDMENKAEMQQEKS